MLVDSSAARLAVWQRPLILCRGEVRPAVMAHRVGSTAVAISEYETINVRYIDGVAVVNFQDSVAMFEADKVQAVGAELMDLVASRKEPRILLNLTNAHFISSAMLAHLVKLNRKVQESRGRIRLCGLRPVILDAFKVSRFDRIFEIFADEASALKKF